MPDNPGIFAELKRRHVWRVAVAYAVTGWLIIQIATQVFPAFHMPDWAAQFVVILVLLGFPAVVVLAWAFEITPEGIRRTVPADSPDARQAHDAHSVGRLLNSVIITVLILAVGLLGWRLLVVQQAAAPTHGPANAAPPPVALKSSPVAAPVAAQPIPEKSVAVLPFENLSSDKENEYFVGGMQDLILARLADIGELKVISRTSTMQYKSRPDNLKKVAAELGVATILEGSVQKQGTKVLISVQLIDTKTDTHLWAENYTRTLDDIFGVEGEVAEKIATALNAKLSQTQIASLAEAPTTNPAAYDLFLRAEYQANRGRTNFDASNLRSAISLYQQAIARDPKFALAYARLSFSESFLGWANAVGGDLKRVVRQARADAEQALKLAPDLAAGHIAMGYSHYYGQLDFAAALTAFDAALALSPNNAEALAARGYIQRRQGRFADAIASLTQAFNHDPRNSQLADEIGQTCMMDGRCAGTETEAWSRRALTLDPGNLNARAGYSQAILLGSGDLARALAASVGDAAVLKQQRAYLLKLQRKYFEAIALVQSIPDAGDNFAPGSKALQLAELYRMAGDTTAARPLFEQALPGVRAQLDGESSAAMAKATLGMAWRDVATAELGLGHTAAGLAAIANSEAMLAKAPDVAWSAWQLLLDAEVYAATGHAGRAVPLATQALATPGVRGYYSPLLLWLDPAWDPIRNDPGFQALLQQYAKYKPAVLHEPAPAGSTPTRSP